jgi:hypothetical protein
MYKKLKLDFWLISLSLSSLSHLSSPRVSAELGY